MKPKPKHNRRLMYAVAAGAVLALVVLLRSRSSSSSSTAGVAGAADPNAIDPSTGMPYGASFGGGTPAYGSTFADNGSAAAGSLDNVTSALQGLDQDIQTLGSYFTDTGTTSPTSPGGAGTDPLATSLQQLAGAISAGAGNSTAGPAQAPKGSKAGTTPGYHPGHSRGHEYYLPGVGWVSLARYQAGRSGGSSHPASAPTATPPRPVASPAPAAPPRPAASGTAPGYHAGHSRGHEYYLPGVGWVSKARYEAGRR